MSATRRVPIRLEVKVVPGASRDEITGWLGEALKVRVRAAPERGKANTAVEHLLAATLGLAADRVQIVAGHGSSRKHVEITGLTESDVRARLLHVT